MLNIIYFFAALVFTAGLFIMLTSDNYVRKIIGLGVFQSSVLIFFIALSKVSTGVVPLNLYVNSATEIHFSSPLPHVLMLTAIVVGFSTMSVAYALVYQIFISYQTISETRLNEIQIAQEVHELLDYEIKPNISISSSTNKDKSK